VLHIALAAQQSGLVRGVGALLIIAAAGFYLFVRERRRP
jgi:hypothetical protein